MQLVGSHIIRTNNPPVDVMGCVSHVMPICLQFYHSVDSVMSYSGWCFTASNVGMVIYFEIFAMWYCGVLWFASSPGFYP